MKKRHALRRAVGLKHVAEYLGLNPATVSVVLNNTPGRSIPEATRERIRAAARELNYQPSLVARSLQSRRTRIIGILLPDLDNTYYTQVLSGVAAHLMDAGYFYFTVHHGHREQQIEQYSQVLLQRGAEAIIAIDTRLEQSLTVPIVNVAGRQLLPGKTNIILDHRLADELLLRHLHSLGHRRVAFVKGQTFGSLSDEAWRSLPGVARRTGIHIRPELVFEADLDAPSPELGYAAVKRFLSDRERFTAVVTFHEGSTKGVLRGLHEAALRVPEDVSVVTFEGSGAAEFGTLQLTAIRQPSCKMGTIAAQCILDALNGSTMRRKQILVKPELIVRESTARAGTR